MSCWEESFFMMLGRQIGDPLWIEKEITSRTRLDKGKILILIPHD